MEYKEQLKCREWQVKRSDILIRDKFFCQKCGHKSHNNHVHHLVYEYGRMAWEYEDKYLITLCKYCHEKEHKTEKSIKEIFKTCLLSGMLWNEIKTCIKVGN